jgi:nitrite reductase/ring-hydroxylating ferredoxin subunit
VPTALAGLADYSAIDQDAVAVGSAHALLNSTGLGLYLLSMWARARDRRGLGVLLSTTALGIVGASAGLGGDLVYRRRVGVNHAPLATTPADWMAVLPLAEIAEYEARRVEIDGTPVLVYRDVEAVYAIGAMCSHAGGPLEQGTFDGACVECPWHQSVFDMRDGRVVHGPATLDQPSYQARIRDGKVEIRLNPEQAPNLAPAGSEDSAQTEPEQAREIGAD